MPARPSSKDPNRPSGRADLEQRRLQTEALLGLSRIQRDLEQRIVELFADHGLREVTPSQGNALMILFQNRKPMTARALAGVMGLSQVTVGRFVKALEGAGWIVREPDPADHRANLIRPTRKAYRALPRFIRVSNTLLDEAFCGFEPAQVRRFAKAIDRVRRNVGGVQSDGPGDPSR